MNMARRIPDDSLRAYAAAIRNIVPLTAEEERRLAKRYRENGDARAAHRLVESNLRFVVKIALEFRAYPVRRADLVQEGNLGLMHAVQKFDPAHGNRLITYAVHWIRAYMRAHVMRSWSMVTIGRSRAERQLFFALRRAQAHVAQRAPEMAGDGSSTAAADRVAAHLGVDVQDVLDMQSRLSGHDASLDAPLGDDGPTLLEIRAGDGDPADATLARNELRAALGASVEEALEALDARERDVVRRRLLAEEDADADTLVSIADDHGVSRERMRQLELRGLEKLRLRLQPIAAELEYPGARSERRLYDRAAMKGRRRPASRR